MQQSITIAMACSTNNHRSDDIAITFCLNCYKNYIKMAIAPMTLPSDTVTIVISILADAHWHCDDLLKM